MKVLHFKDDFNIVFNDISNNLDFNKNENFVDIKNDDNWFEVFDSNIKVFILKFKFISHFDNNILEFLIWDTNRLFKIIQFFE